MNTTLILCVGMMSANANDVNLLAEHVQPVQVAFAGGNIANGGCYGTRTNYSPVAQYAPANGYRAQACNCPDGRCDGVNCQANCANGQCRPTNGYGSTAAGLNCANGQCQLPSRYGTNVGTAAYRHNATNVRAASYYPESGNLDCPNGKCDLKSRRGFQNQPAAGNHYPMAPATRYNVTKYPPRGDLYTVPASYNTNRYQQSYPSQNSSSPFFK